MDIPDLQQPREPPRGPQFPRNVRPGSAPGAATYQQLRYDIDRQTYVMDWLVEEAKEHRQREGLPPRPFHPSPVWHQQQQNPLPYYLVIFYLLLCMYKLMLYISNLCSGIEIVEYFNLNRIVWKQYNIFKPYRGFSK
ncbi:hypothetical protein Hanom_Chr13g01195601 [Helianthus anomalus]